MVDALRLRVLLDRIGTEVAALRRLSARGPETLLADEDLLAAVKYRFVVAVEAAIDVCQHVVAAESLPAPSTYAASFGVLADGGWLDPSAVPDLQAMARFRNLLVHGYADVDDRRVVEISARGSQTWTASGRAWPAGR